MSDKIDGSLGRLQLIIDNLKSVQAGPLGAPPMCYKLMPLDGLLQWMVSVSCQAVSTPELCGYAA